MITEQNQNPITPFMHQMEYYSFSITTIDENRHFEFFISLIRRLFFWNLTDIARFITMSGQLKEVTIALDQYLEYGLVTAEQLDQLIFAIANNPILQKINLGLLGANLSHIRDGRERKPKHLAAALALSAEYQLLVLAAVPLKS